jgi:nucleoside-diphosphate-sugar epimerase
MAIRIAGTSSRIHLAPPRTFDVSRFFGTRDRAGTLLNWEPKVSLITGLTRLIADFRAELATESKEAVPT